MAGLSLPALSAGASAQALSQQQPAAGAAPGAGAATPGPDPKQIRLYIVQQSLVSAFETLGVLGNIGVQIDPAVDRVIAGVNLAGTPSAAFAQLARHNGLFYWFDGARYVISPANGLPRWMVSPGNLDPAVVAQLIGAVAPVLSAESIRHDPQTRLIHVSGPRELKDALELAIDNAGRERTGGIAIIRYGVSTR
jgi:type II secretory pathway component GspD/PulD (secretin)